MIASHPLTTDQAQALTEVTRWARSGDAGHRLTGAAGTGKTFTLGAILDRFADIGVDYTLSATTHKAADVLSRQTGRAARTIHSILSLRPSANDGVEELQQVGDPQLSAGQVVVVDEASMVGDDLMRFIARSVVSEHVRYLFVGDKCQLPPVGGRSVAFDIGIGESHLREVVRQSAGNPIIEQATAWRHHIEALEAGLPSTAPTIETATTGAGDGVRVVSREEFDAEMEHAFTKDDRGTRVACYTNKAALRYNARLRPVVLGDEAHHAPILRGEWLIANRPVIVGDEVKIQNNEDVCARSVRPSSMGDLAGLRVTTDGLVNVFVPADWDEAMGLLSDLKREAMHLQRLVKLHYSNQLDDERRAAWRAFYQTREALADLRPPYAGTTHKLQGSTHRTVFVDGPDLARCWAPLERARLTYTALTRASHAVIVKDSK